MRAGKLRHRVVLQKRGQGRDSAGQEVGGWVAVDAGPIWADIRFINGREYATSGTVVGSATASIRVRYREDLDATMRVLHRGTIFNILAVLPDEDGRDHVDLACNTGVNDG